MRSLPCELHFFNKLSFQGWGEFLKLGCPSMLMSLVEGSAFELLTVYAGFIGVTELGANSILANLSFVFYMIPLGIGIAANATIGKELGANNVSRAIEISRTVGLLCIICAVLLVVIILIFFRSILRLYTSNHDLISASYSVIIPFIITTFADTIQGSLKGIFRALGKQQVAANILIITFGVISNITAPILAFYFDMGLQGIWFGFALGSTLCVFIFTGNSTPSSYQNPIPYH